MVLALSLVFMYNIAFNSHHSPRGLGLLFIPVFQAGEIVAQEEAT